MENNRLEYISRNLEMNKNKGIFWDRDGTINALVNNEPPRHIDDIYVYPEAISLMRYSKKNGYMNFIITNQPDYALGKVGSIGEIVSINAKILYEIGEFIDDYRICIHHPKSNHEFLRDCNCRKPKTGMIDDLVEKYNIDKSESIIIGDGKWDMDAGRNANIGKLIRIDPERKNEDPDVISVNNLKETEGLYVR